MPFRDPANHPLAWSHLAGRMVSTWSGEWARQCEVDTLLAMPAAKRLRFINGSGVPEDGRDGRQVRARR